MPENPANTALYDRISTLLEQARKQLVRQVNQTMVYTYFEIGRMIVDEEQQGKARAAYGEELVKELSLRLTARFGKGFSQRNLEQMRQFFVTYHNTQTASAEFGNQQSLPEESGGLAIPHTLSAESIKHPSPSDLFNLSWSHYLKLMRIDDPAERRFYEIEAHQNNWSVRELQRQYDSGLYQRLALSRNKEKVLELAHKGQVVEKPEDIIKDPYILEFIGLPELATYSETELETRLIDKLEQFLLELGKGFTFAGRQQRISMDEKHFYVDLVFYNRLLRSFILIDLKIGELKHQDLGQMQMYVNYYDRFVRLDDENRTVGIVLCRDKSDTLVEITLPENNRQIFASKYKTVLPSKAALKQVIENED